MITLSKRLEAYAAAVMSMAASHYDVTVADIKGRSRSASIAGARNLSYLALRLSGATWGELSLIFNRARTNGKPCADSAQARVDRDPELAALLQRMRACEPPGGLADPMPKVRMILPQSRPSVIDGRTSRAASILRQYEAQQERRQASGYGA